MALRDQPYIPLYIQDFLTDEKLIECSAQTTGVYVRLMCILHKSEEYGKLLLKQKDKQTTEQTKNFAAKLTKQMPYSYDVVLSALIELLAEKVLFIEGDFLGQKRMIHDNALSLSRSKAGKKGGDFAQAKIKANQQANTENENEIETVNDLNNKESVFEKTFSEAFDPITCERYAMAFRGLDLAAELQQFKIKCDNDPGTYHTRDAPGLRTAFQYQLKNSKPKLNGKQASITAEGTRDRLNSYSD